MILDCGSHSVTNFSVTFPGCDTAQLGGLSTSLDNVCLKAVVTQSLQQLNRSLEVFYN